MLFQSQEFVFGFLPLALLAFWGAATWSMSAALASLTLASLLFYAYHVPVHLLILTGSILVNFLVGRRLAERRSAGLLWLGLGFNLGLLALFKYSGFVVANLDRLTGWTLADPGLPLPLAISFFTFQKIAYLIDVYRASAPRYRFREFLLFVMFFPQLIAGPIVHHAQIMPQLRRLAAARPRFADNFAVGMTIFAVGLFKKVGIADSVSVYADLVFDSVGGGVRPDLVTAWCGALAYALQIYFDFSGYSDMAIGLARLFGIALPLNFRSPYRSTSIIEFWHRWHVTLSSFLRDYLYIPLGGNRQGPVRRIANLWIVMLLGGLWHGAGWTFVAWGGLHACYLSVNHAWRALRRAPPGGSRTLAGTLAGWALTMVAVMVAWVFFRAPDFGTAWTMLVGMAGGHGIVLPEAARGLVPAGLADVVGIGFGGFGHLVEGGSSKLQILWLPAAVLVAVGLPTVHQWIADDGRDRLPGGLAGCLTGRLLPRWQPGALAGAGVFVLLLTAVAYQARTVEFLYFQF